MEQAVPGKERLLVTSQILRAIKQVLEPDPDIVILWAACVALWGAPKDRRDVIPDDYDPTVVMIRQFIWADRT